MKPGGLCKTHGFSQHIVTHYGKYNFDKPRLDVFEAVFGSDNTTTAMQKTFAAIHAHFQYIVDSSNQKRVVKSDEIDLVTLS